MIRYATIRRCEDFMRMRILLHWLPLALKQRLSTSAQVTVRAFIPPNRTLCPLILHEDDSLKCYVGSQQLSRLWLLGDRADLFLAGLKGLCTNHNGIDYLNHDGAVKSTRFCSAVKINGVQRTNYCITVQFHTPVKTPEGFTVPGFFTSLDNISLQYSFIDSKNMHQIEEISLEDYLDFAYKLPRMGAQ